MSTGHRRRRGIRTLSLGLALALAGGTVAAATAVVLAPPPAGPASAPPARGPARELALALTPGEPFRQRMTVEQSMSQVMPGMGVMDVASTVILDVTHQVLDETPTAGRFVLQLTIDRVRVDARLPMMAPSRMDTDDRATLVDNPSAAAFGALFDAVGRPLRYEITAAAGFVADGAVAGIPVGQGGTGAETSLRSFIRQMVMAPPGRPVATGDTWSQRIPGREVGLGEDLVLDWTLRPTTDAGVELALASTLQVRGQTVPAGPGLEGSMSMDGTTAGIATVRPDGWVAALKTKQTTTGAVTVPMGEEPMEIPFTTSVTTTIETLK
jgi:hypothetical protein